MEDTFRVLRLIGPNKTLSVLPELFPVTDEYAGILDLYLKECGSCVIMMACTSLSSKETVQEFADLFKEKNKNPNKIILALNKTDCDDERVITRQEGVQLAKEIGCSYMETSAKTGENIDDMIEEAIKLCIVDKIKEESKGAKKLNCICQ